MALLDSPVIQISKSTVFPDHPSSPEKSKLTVSDLPMLSCNYIQKGILFTRPPFPIKTLISLLKESLSKTLTHFPALAGRLVTDSGGVVYVNCNDAGVEFHHANAGKLTVRDVVSPVHVPDAVQEFFALDGAVSYDGHFKPLVAVQVTELADGVFIACTVNHAVTDGTSFWDFFNTWAEISCGAKSISRAPDLKRIFVKDSPAVLKFDKSPVGFAPVNLRERIFHFTREDILKLKARANNKREVEDSLPEILGKQSNDHGRFRRLEFSDEVSSFQSLCAHIWRGVTRARKLSPATGTTFRLAINCRHRVKPKLSANYFGNAIQSIGIVISVGDLVGPDGFQRSAQLLHRKVVGHGDGAVRAGVEAWEWDPKCFPLGNFDGASITMGSSPGFPMYENDFGWGKPLAVRSGRGNKFDGKFSAFPAKEGGRSVDVEMCLVTETMTALECDEEFMEFVTVV